MKRTIFAALTVVLSLIGFTSCQYENPALEGSDNLIVKNFNACNMLLGKTDAAVQKELVSNLGWTYSKTEDGWKCYTKKYDGVDAEIEVRFGSGNKACAFDIDYEPTGASSILANTQLFTNAINTFGASCELSTKETPVFRVFVNSSDEAEVMDFATMQSRIGSSTSGYELYWAVPEVGANTTTLDSQLSAAAIPGFSLDVETGEYRDTYSVEMLLSSQKYK